MKNFSFSLFLLALAFHQSAYSQLNDYKIFISKLYATTLYFHDDYKQVSYGEENHPFKINSLLSDTKSIALETQAEFTNQYTLNVTEGGRRYRFVILYKEHLEDSERDVYFTDLKKWAMLVKESGSSVSGRIIAPVTTGKQANVDSNRANADVFSLITQGDQLKKNGQLEEAQKKYEQALQMQADNSYAQADLTEVKSLIEKKKNEQYNDLITKANNAFTDNNLDDGLRYYTQALTQKPDDIYLNSQIELIKMKMNAAKIEEEKRKKDSLFYSYINAGDKALSDTLYTTAKIAYEEALKIKPGDNIAILRKRTLDEKILTESLDNERRKNDVLYISYLTTGDKDIQEKSYDEAIIAYKEALKIKPNDVTATTRLNAIAEKISDSKRQLEQHKKDSLFTTYMSNGDYAFKNFLYDVAKASYDSALIIKSDDVSAKAGQEKATYALAELKKQVEKELELQKDQESQKEYTALINTADEQYNLGMYTEAKISYTKALQLNKNDKYSTNKINQINKIIDNVRAKNKQDSLNNINYTGLIIKADKAFEIKDYANARQLYSLALKYKDDDYAKNRIDETGKILAEAAVRKQTVKDSTLKAVETNKKYNNLLTDAKTAYNKKDYTTARVMYSAATELKPDETEANIKLVAIDKELKAIAEQEAIKNISDSLTSNGEIALANNEFLVAMDNFIEAKKLTISDQQYYLQKQIDYIEYQLKVAEQQRKQAELKQAFDTAMSAYRQGKDALKYLNYEDALFQFKKFLSILDNMDSTALSKSDYNLDAIIQYAENRVPAIEEQIAKSKIATGRKDTLQVTQKVYGSYAATIYYSNPKDPNLNYVYKKYPDINFNMAPLDQHFDSILNYNIENNLIGREIMSLKPELQLADSSNHIKLICENIKFRGNKVYLKFLIMNYDTTEFLTGKMLLNNYRQNGDTVKLYPNYIANYPIILPGRQKVVVYVTKALSITDDEKLNFEMLDRLNNYRLSVEIPGVVYNRQKPN